MIHAKTRIAAVNRSVGEFDKDLTQFCLMYWLHQYVLQRQTDSSTKSFNYRISSALSLHAGSHVIILDQSWLYLSANLPSLRNLLDIYGMDLSYHLIAMTLLWGMLFSPNQIRGHSKFLATGNSLRSHQHLFRVSRSAIKNFISEVKQPLMFYLNKLR